MPEWAVEAVRIYFVAGAAVIAASVHAGANAMRDDIRFQNAGRRLPRAVKLAILCIAAACVLVLWFPIGISMIAQGIRRR